MEGVVIKIIVSIGVGGREVKNKHYATGYSTTTFNSYKKVTFALKFDEDELYTKIVGLKGSTTM